LETVKIENLKDVKIICNLFDKCEIRSISHCTNCLMQANMWKPLLGDEGSIGTIFKDMDLTTVIRTGARNVVYQGAYHLKVCPKCEKKLFNNKKSGGYICKNSECENFYVKSKKIVFR